MVCNCKENMFNYNRTSLKQFCTLFVGYKLWILLIHPKIFENCKWVHQWNRGISLGAQAPHFLDSDGWYYTGILLFHPMAIDWLVVQTLHHSHLVFIFYNNWEFGGARQFLSGTVRPEKMITFGNCFFAWMAHNTTKLRCQWILKSDKNIVFLIKLSKTYSRTRWCLVSGNIICWRYFKLQLIDQRAMLMLTWLGYKNNYALQSMNTTLWDFQISIS